MHPFILLVNALWRLPVAVSQWFFTTTIKPKNFGQPLPPIRYDGDPNDIYLA